MHEGDTVEGIDRPGGRDPAGVDLLVLSTVNAPYRRSIDAAARIGDTTLGMVWLLFTWSVLGVVVRALLAVLGVPNPARCRLVTITVLAIVVVLAVVGYVEAM